MKFLTTNIKDVVVVEPQVFGDDRGFFMETFRASAMEELTGGKVFVQDNHSRSVQGTLRGLHFQNQQPQGKLVRVVEGRVFDVVVDLRRSSPTYGRWVGEILSADNKRQLWVPEGFAHGFYVLSNFAELLYKCTDYYAPEFEQIIHWNDSTLNIQWPLIAGEEPLVSNKDALGYDFNMVTKFD